MSETLSIRRRSPGQDDFAFDRLRREAIELIQQVSGKIWTDYNLHDPGVTILEQLVYSITELIYRSQFPLADYLADTDGSVDLESMGLSSPAEAFPCRPTTALDYRRRLLDAVAEADNVWLEPVSPQSGSNRGLYRMSVKLRQGLGAAEQERAVERLRETYLESRNLGEDLAEITRIENTGYELCASIEVHGDRHPAEVLAEIYFSCARCVAGGAVITGYDQLADRLPALDELFDGPLTRHGFFMRDDLPARRLEFDVSDLFGVINAIEGVDFVRQLHLARGEERCFDSVGPLGAGMALDLELPTSDREIRVELTSKGRPLPVSVASFKARYDEISFDYWRSRSTPQDLSLICRPPAGTVRPLAQYYSIQDQFPSTYGINRHGVAGSASADVKARARQLKAYLLIFEQLLVNFLANLEEIKTLFSPASESSASYSARGLKADQVGDLDAVYPPDADTECRRIVADFDNYYQRKSRLLDYLLALYGERFSQNSLRHFDCYSTPDQLEQSIVANKIAYLASIVELGRDRSAGLDYGCRRDDYGDCGLGRRTALLLGCSDAHSHSLTAAIADQDLVLVSHDEYVRRSASAQEYRVFEADELEAMTLESFEQPELRDTESGVTLAELREHTAGTAPLKNRLLSELLLREGINPERYRIARQESAPGWQLLLQLDGNRHWLLDSFSDRDSAVAMANDLRRLLLQLNRASEGIHVVEHILLRQPAGADPAGDDGSAAFRLSVFFPAWSARFREPRFRLLAEETLRINTPAHIKADCYWLEFAEMAEFEQNWWQWLDLKRNPDAEPGALEASSARLRDFVAQQGSRSEAA